MPPDENRKAGESRTSCRVSGDGRSAGAAQ